MNSRAITFAAARPPVQTLPEDERKALRQNFKPLVARRLTALPLLIGELTKGAPTSPDDEWIFASEFGGAISLENFLASFPTPSPTHFQNSIQPGPLDLVNVSHRQPARQLTPLIGGETLLAEALLTALISPARVVHLVGGEEFGEWSSSHDLGSTMTFAYYLRLELSPPDALGELTFTPGHGGGALLSPEQATTLIAARESLEAPLPERGLLRLAWR